MLDVSKSVEVVKHRGIKVRISMRQPDLLLLPPLEDEPLAALVSALSENGAGVVGVMPQTKNLEEIFLSLTNRQGEVA